LPCIKKYNHINLAIVIAKYFCLQFFDSGNIGVVGLNPKNFQYVILIKIFVVLRLKKMTLLQFVQLLN